jgi:hypothetical protein
MDSTSSRRSRDGALHCTASPWPDRISISGIEKPLSPISTGVSANLVMAVLPCSG